VKFEVLLPHLDERQRRLLLGAEARALGHGRIRLVARAAGVREATVSLGVTELDSGQAPLGRVRRPGGGRKRAADTDMGLRPALLALVELDMRGDPMSPLRWTAKSTRNLAVELTAQGHWWNTAGHGVYPHARRLLITADAGGSNGYRTRAWKTELAAFALETGLAVTVCHFPLGTQCRCLITEVVSG